MTEQNIMPTKPVVPTNSGSFNEFKLRTGTAGRPALEAYSDAIDTYRQALISLME